MRIVWLGFALVLAGCNCGGTTGAPCRSTSQCPAGMACIDSICQPDHGPRDAGLHDLDSTTPPPNDGGGGDGGTCGRSTGELASLPVDIIIAVDGTPSTAEEQAAIRDNINNNLVAILEASGLDYRVILINSNPALCPPPPLGNGAAPGDPACMNSNPPRYYRIPHYVHNSDALTLLLWTYNGFGRAPNSCIRTPNDALRWRDFLRFESQKVFLVFSDDDPETYSAVGGRPACHSDGSTYTTLPYCNAPQVARDCPTRDCSAISWSDCAPGACIDPVAPCACTNGYCPNYNCPTFADRPADWAGGRDFPTELYALEPAGIFGTAAEPRWVFHSLIAIDRMREPTEPLSGPCDICNYGGNTGEAAGLTYQKLSILTGGVRFPSCNTDYSPVFRRIASTIIPLSCTFRVDPTTTGGTFDPTHTNVTFDASSGAPTETFLLDSRPCDGGANGWQWNADFTNIRLCGAACSEVQSDPAGHVRITVGCPTMCAPSDEFCVPDAGR